MSGGGSNPSNKPAASTPLTGSYTPASKSGAGSSSDPFAAFANVDTLPDQGSGQIVTGSTQDNPGGFYLQGLNAKGGGTSQNVSSSGDELLRNLFSMSKSEVEALQQKFIDAGSSSVTVNGIADAATVSAYRNLLQNVQLYQTVNPKNPVTPDELLDSLAAANPKGKGKTVNEKSTSVSLTDRVTAQQTVTQAFADKLGRKPTDQEVAAFTSALNSYEQANPTNTDTTVTTDGSGLETSRNSTTTGKAPSASAYALQYLTDNHGPEQQAVNKLSWYNVALNALQGGAVNTGNAT